MSIRIDNRSFTADNVSSIIKSPEDAFHPDSNMGLKFLERLLKLCGFNTAKPEQLTQLHEAIDKRLNLDAESSEVKKKIEIFDVLKKYSDDGGRLGIEVNPLGNAGAIRVRFKVGQADVQDFDVTDPADIEYCLRRVASYAIVDLAPRFHAEGSDGMDNASSFADMLDQKTLNYKRQLVVVGSDVVGGGINHDFVSSGYDLDGYKHDLGVTEYSTARDIFRAFMKGVPLSALAGASAAEREKVNSIITVLGLEGDGVQCDVGGCSWKSLEGADMAKVNLSDMSFGGLVEAEFDFKGMPAERLTALGVKDWQLAPDYVLTQAGIIKIDEGRKSADTPNAGDASAGVYSALSG